MLSEYQEKVLATYKKMCEAGGLSPNLLSPTTAKLKRESLRVFDTRYKAEDDDILSEFFNSPTIGSNFRQTLADVSPGTFRALWNHLNDDAIKTNERNSDLLAWLIDFKPRPGFRYYRALREGKQEEDKPVDEANQSGNSNNDKQEDSNKTNSGSTHEEHQTEEKIDKPNGTPTVPVVLVIHTSEAKAEPTPEQTTNKEALTTEQEKGVQTLETSEIVGKPSNPAPTMPPKFRIPIGIAKPIITVQIIALLGFVLYSYWNVAKNKPYSPSETREKCMHWTGNRYEPISCDEQTSETPIIPINFKKLNHFKKISNPDKLKKSDIGKIWYAKPNGIREYFTDSGTHPIDTNRALLPLSDYIFSHHISNDRYLLNLFTWGMGIIVFSIIFVLLVVKYLSKKT